MTLANALSVAWKGLKAVAGTISSFIIKDGSAIQTAVTDASAVVSAVDPSIAPIVTELDSLEEVVMGKVLAAANDVANAASLQTLFGEAWPAIEALLPVLKSHPTVVSVTAALGGTTAK